MPKNLNRKLCFMITLFLLISFATGASAVGNRNPFNDTDNSFWAFKDITKMSIRDVVHGYNDGSFQPGKPVSQIEALLMAVTNMDSESQLSAIDINQSLPIQVPAWVENGNKKEVLFAVQQGLIVPAENNFNAEADASRAWVTQLMVRMINKNTEALQSTGALPTMKDGGSVPNWAAGYVCVALKYGLASGYPDGTFKPNEYVTRAEMVSLLSRSELYLDLGQNVLRAKVNNLSGLTLSATVKGVLKTFSLNADTWLFDAKGKVSDWSDLVPNTPVLVVSEGQNVKYVEALLLDAIVTTVKGTVLQVLPQERVLIIKDEKQKILTKTLSEFATITSQNGEISDLSQIAEGLQVEIGLNAEDNLVSLLILNNGQGYNSNGIIFDINAVQKLIIIKNQTGKLNSYQYSDQVVVKVIDQRFPGVKDLQVGDEVKIKLENEIVTEIELIQAKQQVTLSGKVILISAEQRILTLQQESLALSAFPISVTVSVQLTGSENATLTSVLVNDNVELFIEKGVVTSITIKDRNVENTVLGTVAAVDTTNRILTLRLEKDNSLELYDVSQSAEFMINDQVRTSLSEVKKDMKVEIRLVNNKVIYLENKNTVVGTVVSLDEGKNILTLKTDNLDKSYILSENVIIDIKDISRADTGDITKQAYVEIRIENDTVTKINVQKTFTYQITEVDKNSDELVAKDEEGDTVTLDVKRVTFVVPGVTAPKIEDFTVGRIIKVTFMGLKLTKVEAVPVNHGQITSINASSNTVTVQSFEGKLTTYNFNNNLEIINGEMKTYQLSSLAVGNRVEIATNEANGMTVKIMKKITGKFQSLSNDNTKINVSIDPVTWNAYVLASDVYAHSGTQSLNLKNLYKDNYIDVYVLDGFAYEVVM